MGVDYETLKFSEWLYKPEFPSSWRKLSLFSLAKWINGLAFSGSDFSSTGLPIIKIVEIKDGITKQTKYSKLDYGDSYRVQQGDMLFSWSGQPETSIDVFRWNGPQSWLNQHIFKVVPDERLCTPDFCFYLLKYLKPNFVGIARNKQTTGLGHVTKKDLEQIDVGLPPIAVQHGITQLLSAFDNKISLNNRLSHTVEVIAQSLFRSWFMEFSPLPVEPSIPERGPIRHSLNTFASGSRSDWSVRSLYDSARFINGAVFRTEDLSNTRSGFPVIKIGELKDGITKQTKYTTRQLHEKYRVLAGDILFSWSGNPDTSIGIFVWAGSQGWLNQHIFKVEPHSPKERVFIFNLLSFFKPVFIETARNRQTTGLGHVTVEDLKKLNSPAPSKDALDAFNNVAQPLFERSHHCRRESDTLALVRDGLLRELFSGQISLKEAEKSIGALV